MATASTNPYGGMFQYLLHINGTDAEVRQAQAALSKLTPQTAAVYQALNILPEGGLKSWLMANPVQFWTKVWTAIFGRRYTTGDYVLGEVMHQNIQCQGDIPHSQVSDDMVDAAHRVFNQLFGVRIATNDDLNALDGGFNAYRSREVSQGIGDEAIKRAVFLKQSFFYPGIVCWDLNKFEEYPLVDRIPDYDVGKWYSGTLIGGATAVDGLIPVDAQTILKQYPGTEFNPTPPTTQSGGTTATSFFSSILAKAKAQPVAAVAVVAATALAIHELMDEDD